LWMSFSLALAADFNSICKMYISHPKIYSSLQR
jgi:hypothetical protein